MLSVKLGDLLDQMPGISPGSRTQVRATALAIHGFWAHAGLSFPAPFGRVSIRYRRIGSAIPAGTTVTINTNNAL
ncbi:MAG: hypothetical protein KGZ88_23465 [Methylomicrobium sp.]|nr:hypothetical protein [Methylomicrobium sp.]